MVDKALIAMANNAATASIEVLEKASHVKVPDAARKLLHALMFSAVIEAKPATPKEAIEVAMKAMTDTADLLEDEEEK